MIRREGEIIGQAAYDMAVNGIGAESFHQVFGLYKLGIRYQEADNNFRLSLNPPFNNIPTGSVAIHTEIHCTEEGDFAGLVSKPQLSNDEEFTSALTVWINTSSVSSVMVRYDTDSTDPNQARVVHVQRMEGSPNYRVAVATPQELWQNLLQQAHLPETIGVQENLYRLLIGLDMVSGEPVTAQALEQQPLVSPL